MEMIVKPHRKSILAALTLAALAVPAAAHHSYAMFDMNRTVQLDAQVTRITVTELKENTFYASITVQQDGSEIEIDSRPSDAIALAVRAEAPIFAAEDVIEESAIEFEGEDVNEEEIVSEFKQFLEHVTPDEFAETSDDD